MARALTAADITYCLDLLRQHSRDLYLADLLLPEKMRHDIVVLHAFHAEITSATLSFREPMATQIRLQWWTDVINGGRQDEAEGNPLARALQAIIEKHELPRQSFAAKLEAHVFDLYNDPMVDRTMLEGYCGETRSALFHMAGLIAGTENDARLADASGHAGVATGIVNLLNLLSIHRQTARVFVPLDILSNHGLDAAGFLATARPAHLDVVASMVDLAREHLEKARLAVGKLGQESRPVFNQLALIPLYLRRIEQSPESLFSQPASVSQLRKQWALWRY